MDRHKNTTTAQLAVNAAENVQIVCPETDDDRSFYTYYTRREGTMHPVDAAPASLLLH